MKFKFVIDFEDGASRYIGQESSFSGYEFELHKREQRQGYWSRVVRSSPVYRMDYESLYSGSMLYGGVQVSVTPSDYGRMTTASSIARQELQSIHSQHVAEHQRQQNEMARREAQRQQDRARLEEERRNRPFWERLRNGFRY